MVLEPGGPRSRRWQTWLLVCVASWLPIVSPRGGERALLSLLARTLILSRGHSRPHLALATFQRAPQDRHSGGETVSICTWEHKPSVRGTRPPSIHAFLWVSFLRSPPEQRWCWTPHYCQGRLIWP